MQQPPADPWYGAFVFALFSASAVTWVLLASVKVRHGVILPYEARRSVPWGPLAGALAFIFAVLAIVSGITAAPAEPAEVLDSLQMVERLVGLILTELLLTAGVLAAVALFSRATARDLGLPEYANEFARDVWIGVVAWLAAIAPVYGLHVLLLYLQGKLAAPSQHPLVEMVTRESHFGVLLLASVVAVVVAPLCEEIVFRLLLQGWLEKLEDRRLGWRQPAASDGAISALTSADGQSEPSMHLDMLAPTAEFDDVTLIPIDGQAPEPTPGDPPRRGIFGLPYGWVPIIISSLLFAGAHFGYGPDPVPLFFFALILGYIYQRTHRIVPCMVAHALFNLVTVLTLWRLTSLSAE